MLNISRIIGKFIKNSSQRDIDKLKPIVEKINSWETKIKEMPDKSFPEKTLEFKSRIKKAKNFTHRLIQEIAQKKIGENIEILLETKDLSYTNNFYKVTVDSKNKKIEKMNGQIIKVKLKSFSNGKFFAEI